ncbi:MULTISPECIES: tRNA glutamyl-Q(34) synthetase GluQRS [unclassified Psychrobacter]|uniref:tRNA glutamyl-Q(34) synthetase GluQRS n=1 Tax=unclassified Psychrobacter TaxID=196806 RepID=UPI000C32960E|nr:MULTISPECIES: tRNA glutamyl-Q(34) synthetase GluQRS [unclassified Psychrobacter]MBA6245504.1 tRNA glutamyl-Q(34) synthetase GluQRS [Psychrobacter sp. Urea-trap-18]MBA6284737.1 tRNA glutamyl-Q(34) synthetase GluQRS [Psychrobacter sp. Urea-trap-16]MBA6318644.1 tRNA glutamyl-Q(34) synthetase GluQRS [Psychrobacter sp. Urea-trap-20]MBA6333042.1 tRNA glutamyl-Q(34) synthetase GluQRS [Psychrobacter sp. Urea-trap-19]PKG59882.1 tRNA glutamyl-Q(34) synthetase GluQRS [Psychrobacter sp. Choline-3u-12]
MPNQTPPSQPIGRFAPSPTGELHLGSLTTALASFCHIKSIGGKWLLRMEDTDTERCDRQFTEQILMDLEALGLHWDGDVIYQSERIDIYNDYLSSYLRPLTYGCQCSRKDLEQYWAQEEISRNHSRASLVAPTDQTPLNEQVPSIDQVQLNRQRYPRRCVAADLDRQQHKLRIQLPDYRIGFNDGIQGLQWENPQQTLGDMVARRQDGMINYILAASLDDGIQQVTHIMRGLDILPMTTAQIGIMQAARLPTIDQWYHLPLINNADGQKLSKQNLAQPIDTSDPSQLIAEALSLLQQAKVDIDTPENMLKQAIAQWDNSPLQGKQQLNLSY